MVRLGCAKDLHDTGQSGVGAAAHVQRLGGQPHRIDAYHRSSSRSHAAHAGAADTGQLTLMANGPRCSSMRTSSAGCETAGAGGAIGSAMNEGAGAGTGADASRRHLCTRFAFSPWAIAIRATEASGLAHSTRTWVLSVALWRRRMGCLESLMVSTYCCWWAPCWLVSWSQSRRVGRTHTANGTRIARDRRRQTVRQAVSQAVRQSGIRTQC